MANFKVETLIEVEVADKAAFIMTIAIGTAGDNKEYELMTSITGSPIVRSVKTGKTVTITWNAILNAAITVGIDEENGELQS